MRGYDYTCYKYDEETDLKRTPFWIFSVADTPPGRPRTPMFDWLFMNGNNWGGRYAYEKLSVPSTQGPAFRSYHGYTLVTVIPPKTDEEIARRTAGFKPAVRHLIENYDQLWSDAKARLMRYVEKPKQFDFGGSDWCELSMRFKERVDAEREMYEICHYFSTGLGTIYAKFVAVCINMLGVGESDPLFQKLLAGFDNISYGVERRLYALARSADERGLRSVLLQNDAKAAIAAMEGMDSGRRWIEELTEFLHVHGWRSHLEMEYLSPTWVEDPSLAVVHVQKYLKKGGEFQLDRILSEQSGERANAEETLLARVPVEHTDWFRRFMRIVQKSAVWNVENAYYCQMYQYAMTRYVLMEIGKRISRAGCIEAPEDTFFLVPEEIFMILSAPEVSDLKATVRMRRETWEKNKTIVPPPLIAKISPEEVGKIVLKSKNPMVERLITGRTISTADERKAHLAGDISSPGVEEGPARVVFSPDQLGEVRQGEILVAPVVQPSWSPVFSLIKGIVTDRGGILSSSAVVGREYGIPVVSNVIDGTSRIKTGQRIRVDGNIGIVQIVDLLYGKKVLIVDDEPDVIEMMEELLAMCDVVKASTFNQAKEFLETDHFDIAILDIMGVDGYRLLEIAREKDVIAVMLTAHALTLEDTVQSFKKGAAFYIPKEEMIHVETFLNDVLEGREKGRDFWWRWFERFGSYYEKRFGPEWQNRYPEFWEMFGHGDPSGDR